MIQPVSKIFSTLPLKQLQYLPYWWWPFLVLSSALKKQKQKLFSIDHDQEQVEELCISVALPSDSACHDVKTTSSPLTYLTLLHLFCSRLVDMCNSDVSCIFYFVYHWLFPQKICCWNLTLSFFDGHEHVGECTRHRETFLAQSPWYLAIQWHCFVLVCQWQRANAHRADTRNRFPPAVEWPFSLTAWRWRFRLFSVVLLYTEVDLCCQEWSFPWWLWRTQWSRRPTWPSTSWRSWCRKSSCWQATTRRRPAPSLDRCVFSEVHVCACCAPVCLPASFNSCHISL